MMPGDHFFVNSAQERILDILSQELQSKAEDAQNLTICANLLTRILRR